MSNSECVKRYQEKFDMIHIRLPKGERELWQAVAANRGVSVQQLVYSAVKAVVDQDIGKL